MAGKKNQNSGITLTEILVVIAIISFLAAAVLPAYNKARMRALKVRTQAVINALEAAISMYAADFGDYPCCSDGATTTLAQLLQGPVDSKLWKGPYMRFKSKDLDQDNNIVDSWCSPLYYRYPQGERENVPYLLFSGGPDRTLSTPDDIGNW